MLSLYLRKMPRSNSKFKFSYADPESFVRGSPNLMTLFLVVEGIEDPNITINGPSSARQRNAI